MKARDPLHARAAVLLPNRMCDSQPKLDTFNRGLAPGDASLGFALWKGLRAGRMSEP